VDYIQRHLEEDDLGAGRLAAAFGISVRYVHKLFEATGQSVSGFICERRIDRARSLLADRSCSRVAITEVAFALGFRDISYFNRRFKASAGMTPSDFRRQCLDSKQG
jgi:AraC-like DNA-binding protein